MAFEYILGLLGVPGAGAGAAAGLPTTWLCLNPRGSAFCQREQEQLAFGTIWCDFQSLGSIPNSWDLVKVYGKVRSQPT